MINLLPNELKEEYSNYLAKRFVVFFGSAMIFILIIFSILLVATFIFLKIQNVALEEQIKIFEDSEQNRNFQALDRSLFDLIQLYRSTAVAEAKLFKAMPVIEEIVALTPDPVYITNFNLNLGQRQISISGFAPLRENVIGFKEALSNSKYFSKVDSPLSNLIKERNITFNFTLVVKE